MSARRTDRILVLAICLCIILALAIIFRSFLWANLLRPIAVVFWLVWRVIASVNQKFYWGVVIAAALFLVIRLLPKDLPQPREDSGSDTLNQDNGFFPWHAAFTSAFSSVYELEHLRKKILDLYVSLAHQTDRIDPQEAEEMVKSRQIPLSEASRSILLPGKGKRRPFSIMLKIRLALLRAALSKGRGTKLPEIIHDPIDQILTYMEDKAEITHE